MSKHKRAEAIVAPVMEESDDTLGTLTADDIGPVPGSIHAGELAAIDAELAALGTPRDLLEAVNGMLQSVRASKKAAIEAFDEQILSLAGDLRRAQKKNQIDTQRVFDLNKRRDELTAKG